MKEDGRLGIFGRLQLGLGPIQHEALQWHVETILGLAKEIRRTWVPLQQVAGHPDELGALAWKQEGDGDRRNLVRLDDFAPVVVAAVTTDRVRSLGLVALRALDELNTLYRQVGTALALAGMGVPGLWKSHEQPIIRAPGRYRPLTTSTSLPAFAGGVRNASTPFLTVATVRSNWVSRFCMTSQA